MSVMAAMNIYICGSNGSFGNGIYRPGIMCNRCRDTTAHDYEMVKTPMKS
jgi:hypothetical protein